MVVKKAKAKGKPASPRAVPHDGGAVEHVQKAPCSVELSRDAKGHPRWALKLYGELGEMDDVLDDVIRLDRRLRKETVEHVQKAPRSVEPSRDVKLDGRLRKEETVGG